MISFLKFKENEMRKVPFIKSNNMDTNQMIHMTSDMSLHCFFYILKYA